MLRYEPRHREDGWLVFDRKTYELLPGQGSRLSSHGAVALSDLLNHLENQQAWRDEAGLWPSLVA